MADGTERRRNPRYGVGAPVRIVIEKGHTISGTMQDASQSGMLVALPIELELGRTYQIEVIDPQGVLERPCAFTSPRGCPTGGKPRDS